MGRERYDYDLLGKAAERLKELRESKKLSQEKVYFDTGLNIGRIELGKTNISLTTLAILCNYYGISLEEFFNNI
jgi:transcriptional regulator with XRE-family HTH domain